MTDDIEGRVIQLVNRLLPQTKMGNVEWERGRREDQYIYSSPGASVILESVDRDRSFPYVVKVTNSDGDVVATLQVGAFDNCNNEVEELYLLAARRALRVDETFDQLLTDLDNLPPF